MSYSNLKSQILNKEGFVIMARRRGRKRNSGAGAAIAVIAIAIISAAGVVIRFISDHRVAFIIVGVAVVAIVITALVVDRIVKKQRATLLHEITRLKSCLISHQNELMRLMNIQNT
jgi:hypothetical protein